MKITKKLLSVFLSVIMLVTSCSLAFFAYAVDDFGKDYNLQIYYYNDNSEFVEVTEQLQVMEQYDIQLYACLVYPDGTVWNITSSGMPVALDGYTVDWTSDARYLAFCEKNDGKIHGYDATKGEAIRNWLDNEVGTIPVVGEGLKKLLLGMLDNDVTDIDNLDTEDVTKALDKALATINVNEETRNKLTSSLADYLNKFDVGITATLKDEKGKEVTKDTVRVLVTKSDKLLSDVVPNAAFIKNYDSIPRTVAVGYEMDLDGIITPVRTHYKCEWTVTGSAGILGSDLAEVDENGHFTAKQEGTVQIKVSPDIKGLTEKLRNAFEALSKAGDLVDSDTIAKAILLILGIPSNSDNYTTLVNIITRIVDSGVVDGDGTIRFTDEIMTPLANFILYVIYQDSVTIKIVSPDAIPITSYGVSYDNELTEGESTKLKFTNVKPDGAVAHDYKFSVDNEEIAVLTDETTVLGIDGSTWNNNYVTPNKTNIKCSMDGIDNSYELKVYGKNNKNVVYIKIGCNEYLDINIPTAVNPTTYPKRLDANLEYGWVMEDGSYRFATSDTPAYTEDGLAYVTSDGVMFATGCTVNDLVVKEKNGAIQFKQIMSGVQTTGVNFTKKHFWKKSDSGTISTGIRGSLCEVSAYLTPADASFNTLTFTSKNTETVILSATPLTTAQYASAALTEDRRASHATVSVVADENGYATVYAYAIGNSSCYADIEVTSQTGGFKDEATVAFANISVVAVDITAFEDDDYLQEDGTYLITAGDKITFEPHVRMSESGSWKNQGFEDVEWKVSDDSIATISSSGIFIGRDVGTVTVTATSVFGEIDGTVSVKILPDYRALKAAMAECDYDNLDPYDWSEMSWDVFDAFYKEAVDKLENNSFVSQREVDELTENLSNAFHGLVRYLPLTGISLYCADDADGNGFATIDVPALKNYTDYSTTIVPTVYPEEAEYYFITYKSSDESKIKVNADGVCTPVSKSDAAWAKVTVTVTDPKNGNTFSQDLYVAFAKYQVTSVTVKPNVINFVGVGADAETPNATIAATYNTSSATTSASIKQGFFVSSNTDVATVDANSGLVTPVGIGTCTITCYSFDGGYTGVTNVTVTTNKKKLQSAIDRSNTLVEEFYTEDSYHAVMTALTSANAVFNNADATQEEINDITLTLESALNALVRNPYANVYISAGNGGSVLHDGNTYTGDNNKVRVLIEDGLKVTAVDGDGYHFTRWVDANGNTISTNQTETFVIDYSAYFKAEFEEVHSVTGVKIFADGNDTEYYTLDVGALANYTKQSVQLSNTVYPSNANFYRVEYRSNSTTVNLDSNGKLTPADNSTCYAIVDVVVTNTITGEQFVDTVTVAFVKYKLASVSANPSSLVFEGTNSATQTIAINYSASSSSQTPSLRRGFFTCDNEDIARVDSNGVVTPVGIGACTIKFTSYDGGFTTSVSVSIYADKSALRSAIANAESVIQRNYTEDSYNDMIVALNSAKDTNGVQYASQEDVDYATSTLQNAINNLVKLDLIDFDVIVEGNGSVSLSGEAISETGSFVVKSGTIVSFLAKADKDNEFLGWYDRNGNLLSSSAVYTTVAEGETIITARFNKLVYIDSIEMTYDGKIGDFAQKDVSTLKTYTSYSFDLGFVLNPSNPTHYTYSYYLDSSAVNLKLDGTKVSPAENRFAYGRVYVSVTDQSNGRTFVDSIMVSFANYTVVSVNLDKTDIIFTGENDSSENINVSYKADSRNANIQEGYVTVDDTNIANAYMSSGSVIVVSPNSIGRTNATFTSLDGGKTAAFTITVYADKSALSESLDRIKALHSDDYTEETFSAVNPVIDYAQGVYDTEFTSQNEVDEAVTAINSVISSLVLRDVVTIKTSAVGNGYVTVNGERVSTVKFERGENVVINSVPDEHYMIDAWYDENGNVVSHDENLNFIATNSGTYIATFKPIPYITKVVATYNGNETDFAAVNVGALSRYTNQSASFDVKVYPEDAKYTVVGYAIGNKNNNLSLSGATAKPASNNPAYGQIVVTVRDNYSGKEYKDVIYVSFAKNVVSSVSVNPTSMTFDSVSDSSRKITASYKATVSSPNIQDGFFESDDENVARVDASGNVTPVGKGSCVVTFYSYDGGKTATTNVTVNGSPDVTGKIVAMNSPADDNGTVGVAGATVTISGKSATTSANGSFTISDVNSGTYTMTVEYQYGVTRNVSVTVGSSNKNCGTIPIIAVDYDKNGYINARDYLVMKQLGFDNKDMLNNFLSANKYTSEFYK